MARRLFGVEKGIRLHGENSDTLNVDILFGTAAPGGDSGDQDAAALGSIYLRQNGGSSSLYQKVDTTNTSADWLLNSTNGESFQVSANGVTTAATVDSVLVDSVAAVKWYVYAREAANPARAKAFEVWATHNGTPSADATQADDTVYAKLKIGADFNLSLSVDVDGTGGSQVMRLRAASTTAGVDLRVTRERVLF